MANEKTKSDGTEILILILTYAPLTAFRAFVVTKLWRWYLVDLGLAPISKTTAFGIGLILTLYLYRYENNPPSAKETILHSIFLFSLMLLVGWIGTLVR